MGAKTGATQSLSASNPRAERFKINLRLLVQTRGVSLKQLADSANVPYNWLRKASYDGIARKHPSNETRLQALATYFGLSSTNLFWSVNLRKRRPEALVYADPERVKLVALFDHVLAHIPDHPSVEAVKEALLTAVEHLPESDAPQDSDETLAIETTGLGQSEDDDYDGDAFSHHHTGYVRRGSSSEPVTYLDLDSLLDDDEASEE